MLFETIRFVVACSSNKRKLTYRVKQIIVIFGTRAEAEMFVFLVKV